MIVGSTRTQIVGIGSAMPAPRSPTTRSGEPPSGVTVANAIRLSSRKGSVICRVDLRSGLCVVVTEAPLPRLAFAGAAATNVSRPVAKKRSVVLLGTDATLSAATGGEQPQKWVRASLGVVVDELVLSGPPDSARAEPEPAE